MARLRDVAAAVVTIPPAALVRAVGRLPLEVQARRLLEALPQVELADVAPATAGSLALGTGARRHVWSLGAAEQIALQLIVASRGVHTAFEIGTFDGGTTRILAEALPPDGRVSTLDLPPDLFDATQHPDDFVGSEVGELYQDSAAASKITQILADSLTFDPEPHAASYDLVLVDGGHEYEHGLRDTRTALRLARPGGIILWDDFVPYWHGLVRGICEAMRGRELRRLAGMALGVYVLPD